jgi:UDP-N-acetylmuramoyl-L-alanyl-D-glutamate--2,6-diaminopimelate ligase
MKLKDVLRKVKPLETIGSMETEITDVQIDSRKVKKGSLFIAERGTQTDGHVFIPAAVKNGAAAVVCETMPEEIDGNTVFVRLESTEAAAGPIATQFYGDPSRKLKLVGVTGTNGKTTIATLLYNMFRKFGYKCGLCSTVCNYIDGEAVPADHTTPDPVTLNYLLGRMADAGCQYAFMEVSSHSIAQKRIGGLVFAGGIFTNLTRDHLDYHKTFENYRNAKKAFFDGLPKTAFAITNGDDKNGMIMVQNTAATVKTYSTRSMADFRARILEMSFEGMLLEIDGREVSVPFVGKFNVSNLLAVYGAARMLGREAMEILTTLSTLHSVAGRFETLRSPSGYTAIVDYAHTPDALVNVLSAIHEVLKESRSLESKVITVCGAGGNRDKGKRPLMAAEAANRSDRVVITSDNPRFEDPQAIINDMTAGLTAAQRRKVVTIADRREAIKAACMMADKGDVILIAGKGHEDYQEISGVKHHFDDREEVRKVFEQEKQA